MNDEDPSLDDPTLIDKPLDAQGLAEAKAMDLAATSPPWWFDEGDLYWRMHGAAGWTGGYGDMPPQVVNWQIIKAVKNSHNQFAEYWPNKADGLLMTKGRGYFRRMRISLEALAKLHSEFKIFEECSHDHEVDPDQEMIGLYWVEDVGVVCDDGYGYSICRACCVVNGYQTEECVSSHDHQKYLCPTDKILKGDLSE